MIEAYSVAVRIRLINQATAGLMAIATAAARTQGTVAALQGSLNKIKFLMTGGAAALGVGALGLFAIDKMIKPATEYAHQLNIMHMAGMSNVEVANAAALAWKNTGSVITTTATENLKAILDLKNVLGNMKEAEFALPIVTKIGAVMASSSESKMANNAQDIAFSMAKALDIIGAAQNPETFATQAGLMSKVITAFQNRVTPRQFQSVFQYARQSKFDLSDEFKYEFLPSLMLEMSGAAGSGGGGSRGVGPMLAAIYRVTNQGYISKKSLPLWEQLGLVAKGSAVNTATAGTMIAPLTSHALAANNPFLWATQVLEPAIRQAFGANVTKAQERDIVGQLFGGNQLAAQAIMEFITKPANFLRDQQIIRNAQTYDQAYNQARKNDPAFQYQALRAQENNALTALGVAALPLVIAGTRKLAETIQPLGKWLMDHKDVAKGLVYGLAGLSIASVVAGGVMMLAGSILALKIVLPIISRAAGILGPWGLALYAAGEAVYAMWKNWDASKDVFWNIRNEMGMFFTWLDGWARYFHLVKLPGSAPGTPGASVAGSFRPADARAPDVAAQQQMQAVWDGIKSWWGGFHHETSAPVAMSPLTAISLFPQVAAPGVTLAPRFEAPSAPVPTTKMAPGVTLAPRFEAPSAPVPTTKMAPGTFALTDQHIAAIGDRIGAAVATKLNGMGVNMDGRQVGQIVGAHLGDQASRPSTGPSQFDPKMSPIWPDFGH